MKYELAKYVIDVRKISPRIISVNLVLCGKAVIIICLWNQSGRNDEDKNCFYDNLSAEVQSKNGNYFILGDFTR